MNTNNEYYIKGFDEGYSAKFHNIPCPKCGNLNSSDSEITRLRSMCEELANLLELSNQRMKAYDSDGWSDSMIEANKQALTRYRKEISNE